MYTRNSDSEKDRDRQTERRSHTGRQGQKQKQSANRQIDIEESIALKKIFRVILPLITIQKNLNIDKIKTKERD